MGFGGIGASASRLLLHTPDSSLLMTLVYLGAGLALIPVCVRWGFGANALHEEVPNSVGDEIIAVSAQHEEAINATEPTTT